MPLLRQPYWILLCEQVIWYTALALDTTSQVSLYSPVSLGRWWPRTSIIHYTLMYLLVFTSLILLLTRLILLLTRLSIQGLIQDFGKGRCGWWTCSVLTAGMRPSLHLFSWWKGNLLELILTNFTLLIQVIAVFLEQLDSKGDHNIIAGLCHVCNEYTHFFLDTCTYHQYQRCHSRLKNRKISAMNGMTACRT